MLLLFLSLCRHARQKGPAAAAAKKSNVIFVMPFCLFVLLFLLLVCTIAQVRASLISTTNVTHSLLPNINKAVALCLPVCREKKPWKKALWTWGRKNQFFFFYCHALFYMFLLLLSYSSGYGQKKLETEVFLLLIWTSDRFVFNEPICFRLFTIVLL